MSPWMDFGVLQQSMGIEQVLASYRVEVQRVGHHQRRGPCPLPSGASRVLAWTWPRTCGRVIRPPAVRDARAEWVATFLDLVAVLEGFSCEWIHHSTGGAYRAQLSPKQTAPAWI
jgi:hypothetical protein